MNSREEALELAREAGFNWLFRWLLNIEIQCLVLRARATSQEFPSIDDGLCKSCGKPLGKGMHVCGCTFDSNSTVGVIIK